MSDQGPSPMDLAPAATRSERGSGEGAGRLGPPLDRVRHTLTRARLEYVFLVIALCWGVVQVFLVPPLQVPDEGDHWFRAWALTDGQITADRQGMLTLPASFAPTVDLYGRLVARARLPVSLKGQPGFTSYPALFNGSGTPGTIRVVSRVASYGPVGYLPQAAGIAVGRVAGAPPLTGFYLARLANLFASIALLFLAIRLAPFGKQLFAFFALLPMTMFELASVSSDALTISGALLFISLVLWASTRESLRRTDVGLIGLASAVLLNVKPGYGALVLLLLLIRPAQLGGRARYAAFVAGSALAMLGVFGLIYLATATEARAQAGGDSAAQLAFILHQPLDFLAILWANVSHGLLSWAEESMGVLGWLRIKLPLYLYAFILVAGLGFFFGTKEDVPFPPWRRVLLAVTGLLVFLTIAVAVYAFLEPLGSGRVFIQGRYLAPVLLLLLLSVYGIRFARPQLGRLLQAAALAVMMAGNLLVVVVRYRYLP